MSLFILRWPERPLWGDYGRILLAGMASLPRKDGLFQIERTGPFAPPIAMPFGAVVVTDDFRSLLESSGLTGFTFRPVIKSRIVRLDWHLWDLTAEEPEEYPSTGEPEDYILDRLHSPEVSEQIGALWELCLEEHAEAVLVPRDPAEQGLVEWSPIDPTHEFLLIPSTWDGADWFRAKPAGHTYLSEDARTWLLDTVPEWVSFEPAPTRHT